MTFNKEEFYRAFGEYAGVPSDVTITSVEEKTVSDGYCETCYYEYVATIVRGVRENGEQYEREANYSLADFINSLT